MSERSVLPGATPEAARRDHRPALLIALTIASFTVGLILSPAPARVVVLPLYTLIFISVVYLALMIRRDRRVPVVEVGSVFVAVVTIYGAVPLLNFLLGGLQWSETADNRLFAYQATPSEVGSLAWSYVALLSSFVVAYLVVRGRPPRLDSSLRRPPKATTAAVVILTVGLLAYFRLMGSMFDLSYTQGYAELQAGAGAGAHDLPLIVRQVSHNLYGILSVEKQLLLILLVSGWASIRNRVILALLIAYEAWNVLTRFGARTELVLLAMTVVLLYDRFVRPLSVKVVAIGLVLALAGVLAYGVARDALLADGAPSVGVSAATSNNEFQVLFGNAFDLRARRATGLLYEVPWQVYVSDLYMVIPSQLLPFEKIDPAQWYIQVLGDTSGMGYMFGILAQAEVGWGTTEVVLRGAFLGVLFALIHRWYARRQSGFWPTAAYVFLLVWTYYAFRATALAWVYFYVYRFVPAVVATVFVTYLISRRRARRASTFGPAHATGGLQSAP